MFQPTTRSTGNSLPALMFTYNAAMLMLAVAGAPLLLALVWGRKKRRETFAGRLGRHPAWPAPKEDRPLWIHALSVGEVMSSLPLVDALRRADDRIPIVFSASTQTGYHTATTHLAGRVSHLCYFPYDWLPAVRRAFARIRPRAVVIVESDIWPNFLATAHRLSIPVLLANARLSERSLNGYRRFGTMFRPLFHSLSGICCQSPVDLKRFRELGIEKTHLHLTGNLKFDHAPPLVSEEETRRLRRRLGLADDRRVIIGGSTHDGEELMLLSVYRRLTADIPNLDLILVPRDPQRAAEVLRACRRMDCRGSLLSAIDPEATPPGTRVVIVDRMGLLGRLYPLADVAFVGGSLVPEGGHNPLEAAASAKPVVFGPDMSDFISISRMLVDGGGAVRVPDDDALYREIKALLDSTDAARRMGKNGRRVFDAHAGAADRVAQHVFDGIHTGRSGGSREKGSLP